jgi:hypothetical protein
VPLFGKKKVHADVFISELPIRPTQEQMESWWMVIEEWLPQETHENARVELYLFLTYAIDAGICQGFKDDSEAFAALNALYGLVGSRSKELLEASQERRQYYVEAAQDPHPEFGVSYSVGKAFSSVCGGGTDIAVMMAAGKLFLETVKTTKAFSEEVSSKLRIVE